MTKEKKGGDMEVKTHVTIKTTGRLIGDNGAKQLSLLLTDTKIVFKDAKKQESQERPLDGADRPFFFTQASGGRVTHVTHPVDETELFINIKKELAGMFSFGDMELLKHKAANAKGSLEVDKDGIHDTMYVLLEETATHLVVQRKRARISHHAEKTQMHHRSAERLRIRKDDGALEESDKDSNVATSNPDTFKPKTESKFEKCKPINGAKDPSCTPGSGPRGERVQVRVGVQGSPACACAILLDEGHQLRCEMPHRPVPS